MAVTLRPDPQLPVPANVRAQRIDGIAQSKTQSDLVDFSATEIQAEAYLKAYFTPSSVAAIMALTPLVYWQLNDSPTTLTIADSSGNVRNGTVVGTPRKQLGAGVLGSKSASIYLSGNKWVASTYAAFSGSRSICMWYNRDNAAEAHALWGGDHVTTSPYLRISAGDALLFKADDSDVDPQLTWSASGIGTYGWHHIALTLNQADLATVAYVDGVSLGAQTAGSLWNATAGNFLLGRSEGSGSVGKQGRGWYDTVSIHSGVLTPAQVLDLAQRGRPQAVYTQV